MRTKQGACTLAIHTANKHGAVRTTTSPQRSKHNSGSGGESVVYQDPRAEFLFLLGINLSINPLLMGQLWVSASHLQDANQAHKLRDQPLGQRCSSASEWLFKQGDARIDFSSRLKGNHEGRGQECKRAPQSACIGCGNLRVWMGAVPRSPVTLRWSGGLTEWPSREAVNLQTQRGKKLEARGGQGWQGQHQQRSQ